MINGIDTASGQAGISFSAVKAAGYAFAIVKAGGYNVKPMYVAPHYHEQIDGAKAAGLFRGHYWVVGSGDPIAEADYFASILYKLDAAHDILALDDERLDSNATFWTNGNVTKFFIELHKKTGIPYHRMWFYVGAYNGRSYDWPGVKSLGVRVWVASYGNNDTVADDVNLGGKLDWDIQQYTSNGKIDGFTVDLSYSNLSAVTLFTDPTPAPPAPTTPPVIVTPTPAPTLAPAPKDSVPMYIKTSNGNIYAIDAVGGTKYHTTGAQWAILKQFAHELVVVTDAQAAAFKSI